MNQVLSLIQTARASFDPSSRLHSDRMLCELLFLHEEMIAQLCLERLEVQSNADFLTGMIDHHETTAAAIRKHLDGLEAAPNPPFADYAS